MTDAHRWFCSWRTRQLETNEKRLLCSFIVSAVGFLSQLIKCPYHCCLLGLNSLETAALWALRHCAINTPYQRSSGANKQPCRYHSSNKWLHEAQKIGRGKSSQDSFLQNGFFHVTSDETVTQLHCHLASLLSSDGRNKAGKDFWFRQKWGMELCITSGPVGFGHKNHSIRLEKDHVLA